MPQPPLPTAVKVVFTPEQAVTLLPADAAKGVLVTVTVFETAGQPVIVTLTVYEVVVDGLTLGEATVLPLDHEYAEAAVLVAPIFVTTLNVEVPLPQIIVGEADAVAVGTPTTVTVCDAVDEQPFASVVVTVYDVEDAGFA